MQTKEKGSISTVRVPWWEGLRGARSGILAVIQTAVPTHTVTAVGVVPPVPSQLQALRSRFSCRALALGCGGWGFQAPWQRCPLLLSRCACAVGPGERHGQTHGKQLLLGW